MIIKKATLADQDAWDEYVNSHKNASPYHRFSWVLSIEQAYKHQNASLIAFDNDKIVGVLPSVKMQKPFGKVNYCALPFCDMGFALANDDDITKALQSEALSILQKNNGKSFEYRDTAEATDDTELAGKKVRMVLPLPGNAEALLAGFKSKLRSQIRKAEKNGLSCVLARSQNNIDDFYQIFAINMRKLGSPVHSKKWFEVLFKNYAKHIILSVVYKDHIPVGAGIVLLNGTKAAIPWASTVAQYNKLAPNMMLYWSLLEHVSNHGCTEFDFGRSTYDEGTYKFKRQWGAEPIPLAWTNLVADQATIDKNTPHKPSQIRSLVERTWAKLPLGVTTSLGPKIRKHISL